MTRLRKIIFWLHLIVGIIVGSGVGFMALTGMVMAFEHQIVTLAKGGDGTAPSPGMTPRTVEELLLIEQATEPDARASFITLNTNVDTTAVVAYGPMRRVQINRYTGQRTGVEADGLRDFFRTVEHLHRWFALDLPARAYGQTTTGIITICLFALAISGLVIWFPRKMRWSAWKVATVPGLKLKGKLRDWNWHNVVGFWILLPILLLTTTGMVIGQTWANDLLFTLSGDTPPAPKPAPAATKPATNPVARTQVPRRPQPKIDGLNKLLEAGIAQAGAYQTITLRFESPKTVEFVISQTDEAFAFNRTTITMDRATAEVVKTDTYAGMSPGKQWKLMIVPIHRGMIAGLPGQIFVFLVAAGILLLVYTGFALSWRRWRAWRSPTC